MAVTDALMRRDFLLPAENKIFEVTPAGKTWFGGVGVDVAALKLSCCSGLWNTGSPDTATT